MTEKEKAKALAREIKEFARDCEREEYTDTQEAHFLLARARVLLEALGKAAV
ncbi:MAG: hypothetical protein KGL39_25840 [Patescibacteria group bacterium]|nr:hypothetical protein [Patescibacteria group bacterium]